MYRKIKSVNFHNFLRIHRNPNHTWFRWLQKNSMLQIEPKRLVSVCPWFGLTMCEIIRCQTLYWGHTWAGKRGQGKSRERCALTPTKPNLLRTYLSNIRSANACVRRCWIFVYFSPCSSRWYLLWKINCTLLSSCKWVSNVCFSAG